MSDKCNNGCGECNGECNGNHNKQHNHCPCECCDSKISAEELQKREDEMLKKQGWVAHVISCDDPQTPTGTNYHTHGFPEKFGCPDIQMVLPLDPKLLHGIAHSIVNRLSQKVDPLQIADGVFADKVIRGYTLLFKKATECDREVLRVILPDPTGCLSADAVDVYGEQWKDL